MRVLQLFEWCRLSAGMPDHSGSSSAPKTPRQPVRSVLDPSPVLPSQLSFSPRNRATAAENTTDVKRHWRVLSWAVPKLNSPSLNISKKYRKLTTPYFWDCKYSTQLYNTYTFFICDLSFFRRDYNFSIVLLKASQKVR